MSWSIDKGNSAISMHRGDTGAYWVRLNKGSRDPFVEGDVAIYEVKQGQTVKMHREFNLQPETPTDMEPGNGRFLIAFRNSDTDTWSPGTYQTEIRVSLNPVRSGGVVVDGNTVRTILPAKSTLTILDTLIDI